MMSHDQRIGNYVIISPVYNEEKYIEATVKSVIGQTLRPARWIIVDDGSIDRTQDILKVYTSKYSWIQVVRASPVKDKKWDRSEILPFHEGWQSVHHAEFDFVVKLDGDLDLPASYFDQMVMCFQEDERLGIASGVYLEKQKDQWRPVKMPPYHACGAAKMVRMKCYLEMGGFAHSQGWDTIDEIRAQYRGWRTRHFKEIRFYHLKGEGSTRGRVRNSFLHGQIYYLSGGGALFFCMKVFDRMIFYRPLLLSGIGLARGYLDLWAKGTPRLVSDAEASFYRRLLNGRIIERIGKPLNLAEIKRKSWRST
jgi:glycosyltransferase involved in cell wall biosynthesis